jgi:hypothetical protein
MHPGKPSIPLPGKFETSGGGFDLGHPAITLSTFDIIR